jgi:hypothetical protein
LSGKKKITAKLVVKCEGQFLDGKNDTELPLVKEVMGGLWIQNTFFKRFLYGFCRFFYQCQHYFCAAASDAGELPGLYIAVSC